MTNPAPARVRSVLADNLRVRGALVDTALIAGGAVFTGAMAQVEIPVWPVPITGQTLAVVLVGATLGARRGALSLTVYMLAGLAGLPFFANMSGGLHALTSPSFGYIIGFIPAAALIGWLAQRDWDRHLLRSAAAFLLASAIPFVTGLPYLAIALAALGAPHDLQTVLASGLYPFIVGGVIKALIGSGVLTASWHFLRRR